MKILLIEDDQPTSEYLSSVLETHHFVVDVVFNGQDGLDYANLWDYDTIILDLQLPKIDGISLCRQLRANNRQTPILILTSCQETEKISVALNAGADDYVFKPCDTPQLLARIRALIRRGNSLSSSILTWGPLSLNLLSAQVTYEQQQVNLRNQEYHLLELFLRHPQRIFSRSAIIDHLWEVGDVPSESAVTNLIKDLRNKLKSLGLEENILETLYGLGYRLNPVPTHLLQEDKKEQDDKKTKEYQEGIALINQLTDKFLLGLQQRITTLEEIILFLDAEGLSKEIIQQGTEEAHRLAGSLGTYGYFQASKLARSIETLFTELSQAETKNKTKINRLIKLIFQFKKQIETHQKVSIVESKQKPAYPLVVGIGLDKSLLMSLEKEALQRKLQLTSFSDIKKVFDFLKQVIPETIVFKKKFFNKKDFEKIREIRQKFSTIPMLIITKKDSLSNRLKAVRCGIEKYLVEPVSSKKILEAINQISPTLSIEQKTIMIIDDDPTILTALKNLLHPWGFKTNCFSNVEQFWQELPETNPDLLIIDLQMPNINGIELCKIIRQDHQYDNLPIVIITVHTETKYIQQSFESGANDFLNKPIIKSELVARVFNQINK